MSEAPQIEIYPDDEITVIGYKELDKKYGLGSKSTVDRKIKKAQETEDEKGFPKAAIDDGGKKGWTIAQIKRYVAAQLARVAA